MKSHRIEIPAGKALEGFVTEVRITGMTRFKIRLFIAMTLLKLTARVLGTGFHVDLVPEGKSK